MRVRKGIPVSPGVAVGTAYCIDDIFVAPGGELVEPGKTASELTRFANASRKAARELKAMYQKVATQVGPDEAAIFRAHETILHDQAFREKVRVWIVDHRHTAQAALHNVLNEYTSLFARTKDEYLKERLADLRDVIVRLSGHLTEALHSNTKALPGPIIVVANEVLPSQSMMLGDREVAGYITQTGGSTSHAAILARSRGVPAVSGAEGILSQIQTGNQVIVDGRDGHVFIQPDTETEAAYRKLQREFFNLKDQLAENRDSPALSADGEPIMLLANVNDLSGTEAATAMGGSGVGLYRTEYLFLTHQDVPNEEEQFEAYCAVINSTPNKRVTIRTLDVGGDKTVAYLGHSREANPFLGWRSIRLSFEHPNFFLTQIRAVLRAAAACGKKAEVRLMFPMITTLEEMRKVRGMVRKARRQLLDAKRPAGDVPIGLMVEVPAAAISISSLLEVVDFVSIGSNDLVQYLMAADRDNPKVSHLCRPLSPPVLQVLRDVIESCNAANKPVTLCGEMAGSPRAFVLLFGMGLRRFSMSPAFIPSIKEMASHLTMERASRILRRAMQLKTTNQITRYLTEQIAEICPSIQLMDSV